MKFNSNYNSSNNSAERVLTAHANQKVYESEIVIYGGTSPAVMAAVQAKKMGRHVVIVSPDIHLGGLSSGGPSFTDVG